MKTLSSLVFSEYGYCQRPNVMNISEIYWEHMF